MNAEFANQPIEGHRFGGIERRDIAAWREPSI
jgi:hypothetical protein